MCLNKNWIFFPRQPYLNYCTDFWFLWLSHFFRDPFSPTESFSFLFFMPAYTIVTKFQSWELLTCVSYYRYDLSFFLPKRKCFSIFLFRTKTKASREHIFVVIFFLQVNIWFPKALTIHYYMEERKAGLKLLNWSLT